MKDSPIIFNAAMVRAILGGRKTQTRRPLTQQNSTVDGSPKHLWDKLDFAQGQPKTKSIWGDDMHLRVPWPENETFHRVRPRWDVGDRLWVREEHYRFGHWEPLQGVRTNGNRQKWHFIADSNEVKYDAPESFRKGRHHKDPSTPAWHKRLARFMPRAFSRLTLEITEIRVHRLQEISEEDAKAEGCDQTFRRERQAGGCVVETPNTAADKFAALWQSIYGPDSWEQNPWLWAITFKRA